MAEPEHDSVFREIEEELRQEKYAELWKRYGNLVIAAVIALVLGVAGYQGWRSYDINSRTANSERFIEALRLSGEGQVASAIESFSGIAADAGSGYAMLARFQEAALQAKSGNVAAAVDIYLKLADDSSLDAIYRDMAEILSVLQEMNGGDPATLRSRLAPLTADDNPWRHSAKELSAILAQRSGDLDGARELFSWLSADSATPQGIRTRANEMLTTLAQ